jgi:hypothetical protein
MGFEVSTAQAFLMPRFVAHNDAQVNEDLVRYMKNASANNNTFLVDDPIWAEDFAPNGEFHRHKDGLVF